MESLPLVLCAKQVSNSLLSPECATKRYTDKNDEERKVYKSEDIQRWFNWVSKKEIMPEPAFYISCFNLSTKGNWSDTRIIKLANLIGFDIKKTNNPYDPWKVYGRK